MQNQPKSKTKCRAPVVDPRHFCTGDVSAANELNVFVDCDAVAGGATASRGRGRLRANTNRQGMAPAIEISGTDPAIAGTTVAWRNE